MTVHHSLILGGARSGKSSFAERKALQISEGNAQATLHYVATAESFDSEMCERIEIHKATRDKRWLVTEVPYELPNVIKTFGKHDVVLVDCLTVWLNNVIYRLGDNASSDELAQEVIKLCDALQSSRATIFLVSNEVGMGIVPLGNVTRLFVDHAGWMNQKIAAICNQVYFVAAGIPLTLKGEK